MPKNKDYVKHWKNSTAGDICRCLVGVFDATFVSPEVLQLHEKAVCDNSSDTISAATFQIIRQRL